MTSPIPKPEPRGPRPKKRIARTKRPAQFRVRGNVGKLRKLADDLMSLFVRHKGGWKCWVCTSKRHEEMQMAHLIGKGAHATGRYMESNVRCCCSRCHVYFTYHPEEWTEYLIKRLSQNGYDRLFENVRVRQGKLDYTLEIIYWDQALRGRDDLDKIQERYDALHGKGVKFGVLN